MTQDQLRDLLLCSRDPWYFLTRHVKTLEPTRGVLDYPDFPYLKGLVEDELCHRYLLVPKSRQMMVTWTMIALFLWRAMFKQPGVYIFLSRNERCAEELLERAKFILQHLPSHLRPRLTTNNKSELEFEDFSHACCRFRQLRTARVCILRLLCSGMKWRSLRSTRKSGRR